jgi:hypothetical protein
MKRASSATLLKIWGGQIKDLELFLAKERLPDGWETKVRSRMGLTIGGFNKMVFQLEYGTRKGKPQPEAVSETTGLIPKCDLFH